MIQDNTVVFALGFEEDAPFEIEFESAISPSGGIPYDGNYEVTPKVSEQELQTKTHWMRENLTVLAIPYYEVDNTQRGMTAIIGG